MVIIVIVIMIVINLNLCSSEQSSENSVDLAAPIVSALQAPPTKPQVRKALEVNYILCDASIVGDAAGADGDGRLEVVHPQFLSQAQVKTSTPSAEKARLIHWLRFILDLKNIIIRVSK